MPFAESFEYLNNLYLEPKSLTPEDLRYGYISANTFFNLFHAGFCAPYISNPNYMLLVDFRYVYVSGQRFLNVSLYFRGRSREEFDECHILTATHYESLSWDMIEYPGEKERRVSDG